ncbi:MAG: tRNA (N(6)-L-threonylcarbamoyladenosine(37)-C(2))-methylthiotransferase MtaB [Candidatus Aureabacteria bacterium]|nr:tRNA (N(6)-L-threonylcarbamoyladenosine(37)-C(2))-methylthiotransferase MtaB [Candidatus Auribacterota bacterium]
MPAFLIKTFGCKVNQYDSQTIREILCRNGFTEFETGLSGQPSLIIVNGCTVTRQSDAKVRAALRKFKRVYPGAKLILTGCSAVNPHFEQIKDINYIIVKKEDFPEIISMFSGAAKDEIKMLTGFKNRTRAFLKVQEGCDSFCTYCIVPYVRGKPRSRPFKNIVTEAEHFVNTGFLEIVITGIHVAKYYDSQYGNLTKLLKRISRIQNLKRIRISSIELASNLEEIVELFSTGKPFCPHFHIPLQSGSDNVLKMMGRKYTYGDYLKQVNRIRKTVKNVTLSTDLIVGFPGETEDDYRMSLDALRDLGFIRVHVFPYSPRKGTASYEYPDRISGKIIKKRVKEAIDLSQIIADDIKRSWLGKEVEILVEGKSEGFSDNYMRVLVDKQSNKDLAANSIVNVQLREIGDSGNFFAK